MKVPKVGFVSLGCAKATVDSERILTQLKAEGYGFSERYEQADVLVVNTCGFIESAVDESLEVIADALGANGRVIVTGCLGAKTELLKRNSRTCWQSPGLRIAKPSWQQCMLKCRPGMSRFITCCPLVASN